MNSIRIRAMALPLCLVLLLGLGQVAPAWAAGPRPVSRGEIPPVPDMPTLEPVEVNLPAAPVDDLAESPVFQLAEIDPATYGDQVTRDLERFLFAARRLERLVEAGFHKGSVLDRLADERTIPAAPGLKSFYRFWTHFLENLAVIEEIGEVYRSGWRDRRTGVLDRFFEGYLLGVSADLCRLTTVSRLVHFVRTRPKLAALFNDGIPEQKIPRRSLDQAAQRAVKPGVLFRLYQFHLNYQPVVQAWAKGKGGYQPRFDPEGRLPAYILAHRDLLEHLLSSVAKDGTWYKYVFGKFGNLVSDAIFPLQKSLFEWVGDTRVKKAHTRLITESQLHELRKMLQPGDILVERQDYFLSNIFLPGFWPHGLMYIGTPEEMSRFFDSDPEVQAFVRKYARTGFADYLRGSFPDKWVHFVAPSEGNGKVNVVMEAISEGVLCNSMEHACHADYVAAMRPRLSKLDLAKAIITGFGYLGRAYDFGFDFWTEQDLVCTEFVAKCFAPGPGKAGISFPPKKVMGRMTVRADQMVEHCARQAKTANPELTFVAFLLGNQKADKASFVSADTFHASCKWKGGLWGPR